MGGQLCLELLLLLRCKGPREVRRYHMCVLGSVCCTSCEKQTKTRASMLWTASEIKDPTEGKGHSGKGKEITLDGLFLLSSLHPVFASSSISKFRRFAWPLRCLFSCYSRTAVTVSPVMPSHKIIFLATS